MIVTMLRGAKRAVLACMNQSGLHNLRPVARRRDRQLLILGFHGVSLADEHRWDGALYIEPAVLERRLELLRRYDCTVLPLDEAVGRLSRGNLPARSVVLTFDDGFHDFYEQAFPLLRRFGYPATVYLTTYYCDYRRPIFDVGTSYLLWKAGGGLLETRGLPGCAEGGVVELGNARDRLRLAAALRKATQGFSGGRKDELLRSLAARLQLDYDAIFGAGLLHIMSADEVARVAAAGVDVQLHTHHHRAPVDRGLFQEQVALNQRRIREITGGDARHFCYPSGFYVPELVPWLEELGVASATTCDTGYAGKNSPPLLLPRLLSSTNVVEPEFEAWLYGMGPYFSIAGLKMAYVR